MSSREKSPDFIKGVSILLMVYGHVGHVGSSIDLQNILVGWIYTFHMPMFLLVSGFYFRPNVDALEGGVRVVRRLLIPYFIFISLYLFGLLCVQRIGISTSNLPPESIYDYFRVVLIDPRGAYWFIHSLIIIQLVFLGAGAIVDRVQAGEGISLVLAVAVLAALCEADLLLVRTVCYFVLGMMLRLYGERLPSSVLMGFFVAAGLFFSDHELLVNFSLHQVAWCLSILSFLAGLSRVLEWSTGHSLLAWLGRNSMAVLVMHAFFIVAMKPLTGVALQWESTGVMYSLVVVSLTLLGSLAFSYALDKAGASRYLFGVNDFYSAFRGPMTIRD